MIRQIRILTRVQLCNFLNINVTRYTKDKRKRAGTIALMAAWVLVIAMIWFYVGITSYGYIQLGLGDVLPTLLIAVSSMVILSFSVLKAGSILFQRNSYEILCSLPVPQGAIVVSRFFSMYLGNMLLALLIMIPGMAVQGYMLRPGVGFYVLGILGSLFLPLLPMTAAALLGALVTGVASRMKHKSLVTTVLSILLVLGILGLSAGMGQMEGGITPAVLLNLSGLVSDMIEKVYPPALWIGEAMVSGEITAALKYLAVSAGCFLIMAVIVSRNFSRICEELYSTTATHDYKLKELGQESVLKAFYKKEMKRYFASSIYVTNTIIGPILMAVFAGMIFVMGEETIQMYLPFAEGVTGLIPFLMALIGCLMTPACTSVSMEGKQWWITKSMPVSAKTVFDSKILLSLTINAPFYVISESLLILALKPEGMELLWLLLLPALFLVFASVFGLFINLLMPSFDWENETAVVKQSASAMVGGLGGDLVVILCALPVIFWRQMPGDLIKGAEVVILAAVTAILYGKMIKTDLSKIGS